jgi:hypothetical protein
MSVIFSLADNFLQNGLKRLVHGLYLSIFLGVERGRMTTLKPQFRCYFFHHFILKVTVVISENLTRDSTDILLTGSPGELLTSEYHVKWHHTKVL